MIKAVIWILRLFRGVFTRMGVDFDRMVAIVTVKLTEYDRIDRSKRNKVSRSGYTVPCFSCSGSCPGRLKCRFCCFIPT